MESRFETVFDALADGKASGRTFAQILRGSPGSDLIGALAAAGCKDPVAANAIASELLNRYRRLPFLGAFLVSTLTVILILSLDYVYTGSFLLLDSGGRAYILVGISAFISLLSFASFALWRGRLADLRLRLDLRARQF